MNNMELETDIEALDMEMGDVTIHYCPVIPNPEGEPTAELKTADIEGTIYEIVDEEARTELENKVDKVEGKGLSENDYTDEDKAIVDGVTTALDGKVDKDGDKVLSDNNYSDTDKTIVDGVTEALNGKADKSDTYTKSEVDSALESKVNKDGDKVLSDNNYSDTDKSIVDGVTTALLDKVDKEEGKGLSSNDYTDTEKALVGTIEDKLDKTETAVNSNGLVIATPVTDTAPYIYRQTPVKESFKALMKKIVGASVVWNQLIRPIASDYWEVYSGTGSFSNGEMTVTDAIGRNGARLKTSYNTPLIENHIYYFGMDYKTTVKLEWRCVVANQNLESATYTRFSKVAKYTTVSSIYERGDIYPQVSQAQGTFSLKNAFLVDLTAMFGTTIADYVYTLETSQSGSGIAWLQSYGFFTEDYYAYKQNKLESGCVSAHKTYDGETLLTNTELSPITLRGLFKLSTDKLTVDGDEYNADGSVTRKYNDVILDGSSDESWQQGYYGYGQRFLCIIDGAKADGNLFINGFKSTSTQGAGNTRLVQDGTKVKLDLYYAQNTFADLEAFKTYIATNNLFVTFELATPTTEQTTPFTETEIVGSTEEFIDYEVAQDNRDVAIPVGTETDYYQEMKLPSLPTTSGNHNLIYNIATGFGWS